jgi:hypothetical protein
MEHPLTGINPAIKGMSIVIADPKGCLGANGLLARE